jgi:gliding motility associated protien GldN
MKLQHIKWFAALTLLLLLTDASFAQRKKTRRKQATQQSNYGADTTQTPSTTPPQQSNYGAPATPAGNTPNGAVPQQNLPITVVKGSNGLSDSTKPSLRNDAAIELNLIKDRTPLEYENIREDDAVYRVRVWREIDAREKINLPFRYAAVEDNGSQRFISILLAGIKSGQVTAFSNDDDRFTTPITPEVAVGAFGGGFDTVKKYDRDQNVIGYEVRPRVIEPDSIYKFEVKEEWIFDKETSRMYVRILGIAPVMPYTLSTGQVVEGSDRPLWWVYYPDIRPVLAKYEVYNPKNFGARMTWEDLFESRMFSSFILKSTLDNPYDQTLAQKYPNSSLFRLLEGDKIKDKIFDYEQSLWSY